MRAPRSSDRHRRFDLEVELAHELEAERRRAAALYVVSRFRDRPEVARELLEMLGLLAAPTSPAREPALAPDAVPSPRRGH